MSTLSKTGHVIRPEKDFMMSMLAQSMIFLLGLWGCLAIYNSNLLGASPFYFVSRQFIWLILGMMIMFFVQRVPFSLIRENAEVLALLAYIPLLVVLVVGERINGMRGWFSFGAFYLQPAELAKPFFILALCRFGLATPPGIKRFMTLALITALWMLPILLQPDVGMALIYLAAFIAAYWLMQGSFRHLLLILAACVPMALMLFHRHSYLIGRITGFLYPELDPLGSGWHVRQFQFTLARGGMFGSKIGGALWSNSYLPLAHSDSMFASIVESLGFVGSVPIILLFAGIVGVFYRFSLNAQNNFRRVFILAMTVMLAIQALIHVSVNVTLLPITGLTLPMLSYGGSSLVSTLLAFGIMLSAASHHDTARTDGKD